MKFTPPADNSLKMILWADYYEASLFTLSQQLLDNSETLTEAFIHTVA